MFTNLRIFLLVCPLAAPALVGAEPKPDAETGKAAVLDNDRIIEGDIDRAGDQYRVRRANGETWLPADKVLRLCANLEEAFAYLQSRANLNDPEEHVRLARWCLLHQLPKQAIAEAKAAVEIRPKHVDAQRLLKTLQRSTASEPAPPRPPDQLESVPGASPTLSYNAEVLAPFVTRVQPILMNACAGCHSGDKAGAFRLIRGHDDGLPTDRRTTQHNLLATLAQLDREQAEQSKLLRYAITIHGDADKPPLKGRSTPAYRSLEEWVQLALPQHPRAVKTVPAPAPPVPADPTQRVPAESSRFAEEAPPTVKPGAETSKQAAGANLPEVGPSWFNQLKELPKRTGQSASPTAPLNPASERATPAGQSDAAQPEPADPFDPIIFNRQMHSQK